MHPLWKKTAIMKSQLKNQRGNNFLTHQDFNHVPLEMKASVLPMTYADPLTIKEVQLKTVKNWFSFLDSFGFGCHWSQHRNLESWFPCKLTQNNHVSEKHEGTLSKTKRIYFWVWAPLWSNQLSTLVKLWKAETELFLPKKKLQWGFNNWLIQYAIFRK